MVTKTTTKIRRRARRIKGNHLRIAAVVIVVAAQFYTSGRDIVAAVMPYVHHDWSRAVTFPVSADVAIVAAALYAAIRTGINKTARRWAMFVRYLGFAATLYFNGLASGITRVDRITVDIITATVALMLPALLMIGVVEMVIHASQGTAASRAARETARQQTNANRRARRATNRTPDNVTSLRRSS